MFSEQNLPKSRSSYDTALPKLLAIKKPWYHGVLSREEAEKRMGEMDVNSFLVRESVQDKGNLILSVKNGDKCYHFAIDHGVGMYEIRGTHTPFSSVPELVNYYQQNGLPESSGGEVIQLIRPCTFGIHQPVKIRPRTGAIGSQSNYWKLHHDIQFDLAPEKILKFRYLHEDIYASEHLICMMDLMKNWLYYS